MVEEKSSLQILYTSHAWLRFNMCMCTYSLVMKLMNSDTHSCTVSLASLAILALDGKAFFIILLMFAAIEKNNVLEIAGGFTAEVVTSQIMLPQKVRDCKADSLTDRQKSVLLPDISAPVIPLVSIQVQAIAVHGTLNFCRPL